MRPACRFFFPFSYVIVISIGIRISFFLNSFQCNKLKTANKESLETSSMEGPEVMVLDGFADSVGASGHHMATVPSLTMSSRWLARRCIGSLRHMSP